ncbi:MAG: glycosyltransferase [Gemmatimonadota bacterium]
MKPSVILTTYEQPEWLEKALWGYAVQTRRDFELLIADDGSGPATRAVIERFRDAVDLDVRHVWQPDEGFRKCEILNEALLASRGDYLIFSDGDCVPRADFVETHTRLARPSCFLSGFALRLPRGTSRRIAKEDITSGRAFRLGWLVSRGWWPGHRFLRVTRGDGLARWLDGWWRTRPYWNGGNASTWREALFAANGFEEEMGYKSQDRELGDRLEHLGVRGVQIRHRAVLLHLHHERPWADPAAIRRNLEIRARTQRSGATRARRGLAERRP